MATTFTGTGEEQEAKRLQEQSLVNTRDLSLQQEADIQKQIVDLGSIPKISSELQGILNQKSRNESAISNSLSLAKRIGGFYGEQASSIRSKVASGFFVSGTSSGIKRTSTGSQSFFRVSFSKLTQGLDQLASKQKQADLQKFSAQKALLGTQLGIAVSNTRTSQGQLDIFQSTNRSVRDRLARQSDNKSRIQQRRGRLSLRLSGSEKGLLDESETTETLLN